jgi:hypothetical protein
MEVSQVLVNALTGQVPLSDSMGRLVSLSEHEAQRVRF